MTGEQLAQSVVAKPGDTLILGYKNVPSESVGADIKKRAEALLPGIKVVVIGGISQMVVVAGTGDNP